MTLEEAISTIETAKGECEWNAPLDYQIAFDMAIEALEKQSKWIPVSERLPEEGKDVLITILLRNGVKAVEKSKRADVTMWRGFGRDVNVIAWMPLPEPYKKEGEEEATNE